MKQRQPKFSVYKGLETKAVAADVMGKFKNYKYRMCMMVVGRKNYINIHVVQYVIYCAPVITMGSKVLQITFRCKHLSTLKALTAVQYLNT